MSHSSNMLENILTTAKLTYAQLEFLVHVLLYFCMYVTSALCNCSMHVAVRNPPSISEFHNSFTVLHTAEAAQKQAFLSFFNSNTNNSNFSASTGLKKNKYCTWIKHSINKRLY